MRRLTQDESGWGRDGQVDAQLRAKDGLHPEEQVAGGVGHPLEAGQLLTGDLPGEFPTHLVDPTPREPLC